MKRIINFLALLLLGWQANAQLYVAPGATLVTSVGGISVITVADGDFIVEGTFTVVSNDFHFFNSTGNDVSISGSGFTSFDNLFVDTGNQNLTLDKSISARRVIFESGHFDLNGNNVDLFDSIVDEDETRSFIGPNGGEIIHETILNAPSNENPANLGASITTSANLSDVTIRRTHVPGMGGAGESINRQYTISALNNAGLDATLRFFYLENELNGLSENNLELWSNAGAGWDLQGTTDRDASANWLELSGIDAFSDWTAAELDFTPVIELGNNQLLTVGQLFPNPVSAREGYLQLPISSPEDLEITLRVVDGLGRVVFKDEQKLIVGDQVIDFGHQDLSAGMYQVQLDAGGQFVVLKLVVQ